MLKTISECPYIKEKDNFRTVMVDKSGVKKINDGFDTARDLISYSAKYDENKNIKLKIKVNEYKEEAFTKDSSIILLIDFLKDHGTYLLPFNIKGATDHWWEVALSIKNNKVEQEISEDTPHLENQHIIKLEKIDPKDSEIILTLDLKKLKDLGWCENFPLYIQILSTHQDTITDSFNDPKPYQNSNFLVGAMPINKFLKYNSKCLEITE